MTYTSVIHYTEESIRQCKDLSAFLKKRAQIEMEYAKGLIKLAQTFQRPPAGPPPTARQNSLTAGLAGNNSNAAIEHIVRQQLVKSSTWHAFYEYVERIGQIGDAHRNLALNLQNTIMEPFNLLVKDMDSVRKAQVDRGSEYSRNLQDAYACLRKAKEDYDVLQGNAQETQNNHLKARANGNMREKDIDKLLNKATVAADKADAANETLQVCGEICKNAQEQYYGQLLPVLYEDIRKGEQSRVASAKQVLLDSLFLEKAISDASGAAVDLANERVAQIDVDEDIEEFNDVHLVDDADRKGHNVAVSNLINPVKAGRMLLKRGDFIAGWKSRYFVLMEEQQELYCFENEASLKPREVISLKQSAIHGLDDSYFTRPYCFQLVNVSNKGRQTFNLIAESATEKEEWMRHIGRFAYCCIRGMLARERRALQLPTQGSDEEKYIIRRSFQLSIMEAKELPQTPTLGGLNPYCIVLFDDVKQGRTTTKNTDMPFWGDEYEFEDICAHFTRLRIVIFNHSRMQRDGDLGYVSINLEAAKPGMRVEQWYPIKQLPRPSSDDGSWRGSLRVGFCLNVQQLLPASTYTRFLELATEPSLTCIRILGTVCGQQRENVAKVFMSILHARGEEIVGLKTLLETEIQATDNPNIIFRGNTIATKALDQYMKMVGMDYLNETIGALVRQVVQAKESCEVDPTRVEQQELLPRNRKRLRAVVGRFWEAIQASLRNCPRELIEVFTHLRLSVLARWPGEGQQVHYSAISGFIFLRFFCPAILNPKLFGLMPDYPDPLTSRTFTLIAKILQNLANLTDFGAKEPYMAECNGFIEANYEAMKAFIDNISAGSPTGRSNPPPRIRNAVSRRDLDTLYTFFVQNLEAVAEYSWTPNTDSIKDELMQTLAKLDSAHREFSVHYKQQRLGSLTNLKQEASQSTLDLRSAATGPNSSSGSLAQSDSSSMSRIVAEQPPQLELPMLTLDHPERPAGIDPSASFDDLQTILMSLGAEGFFLLPPEQQQPIAPPRRGSRVDSTHSESPPVSPRSHHRKRSGGGKSFIKTLMGGVGSLGSHHHNHGTGSGSDASAGRASVTNAAATDMNRAGSGSHLYYQPNRSSGSLNGNNNHAGSSLAAPSSSTADSLGNGGRRRFRSNSSLTSMTSHESNSWPSSRRVSEDQRLDNLPHPALAAVSQLDPAGSDSSLVATIQSVFTSATGRSTSSTTTANPRAPPIPPHGIKSSSGAPAKAASLLHFPTSSSSSSISGSSSMKNPSQSALNISRPSNNDRPPPPTTQNIAISPPRSSSNPHHTAGDSSLVHPPTRVRGPRSTPEFPSPIRPPPNPGVQIPTSSPPTKSPSYLSSSLPSPSFALPSYLDIQSPLHTTDHHFEDSPTAGFTPTPTGPPEHSSMSSHHPSRGNSESNDTLTSLSTSHSLPVINPNAPSSSSSRRRTNSTTSNNASYSTSPASDTASIDSRKEKKNRRWSVMWKGT
ncbi:hypothetical protein DFS34DRAFT_609914 [Phlyctochytrium arcticum]|nr:hypothetical protein DFS34DRAFT_609914 [Phlyctochytrium arcticum]